MTFLYKLAHRLARLKADTRTAVSATAVVAGAVIACEKVATPSSPGSTVSQLVVSPKVVTLQQYQLQDFMAVGLTPSGDSAEISVTWSVTGGMLVDTSSQGGRHYARYNGTACGSFKVAATSHPGQKSDTGNVTVTCAQPAIASVVVSPASATVPVGQTLQLTATPEDANGNPLSGRTVSWSSGSRAFATVSGSGLVTGVAAGSATITATSEGQSGSASVRVTPVGTTVTLVGAGDIAECGDATDDSTAALLGRIGGAVFTAGDNAYPDGYYQDYANCWAPSWGRYQAVVHPAAGNHEYHDAISSGAADYYRYFYRDHGTFVGDSGSYYYSYDLGAWHVVVLNTFIDMRVGSPQERWLRGDLAANTKQCTLAYMHYARFSSGSVHGSYSEVQPLWQALYDYGAEIAIAGHDHEYERFAPQTPDGHLDTVRGIRAFVVGTGGGGLYSFGTPLPNSEVRNSNTFGVLKLTLADASYGWEFVPITGQTFTDSGSGTCH